ncbi:MAG: Peptidyl-tRNA hydrolase, partial [uncultured Gemmatimonadetes bacterium]
GGAQSDRGTGEPGEGVRPHAAQRGVVAGGRPGRFVGARPLPAGQERRRGPGADGAARRAPHQAPDVHEPQRRRAGPHRADERHRHHPRPAGGGGRRGAGAGRDPLPRHRLPRGPQRPEIGGAGAGDEGLSPPPHRGGRQAPRDGPGRLGALPPAQCRAPGDPRPLPRADRRRAAVDGRRRGSRDESVQRI